MDELNNIKVSIQEKNEIKKDSPDTLPLNPTAQGFSGQEVRRRLSKSLVGEKGSLLSLVIDKMEILSLLLHSILDESNDDSIIEQLKKKISKDGSIAMEGDLDLDGNNISGIRFLTMVSQNGKIKAFLNLMDNGTILLAGSYSGTVPLRGLDMGGFAITDLKDGVDSKDAVNLGQLNDKINIDFSGLNLLEGLTLNSEIIIRFGSKTYKTTLKEVQKIIGGGSGGGGVSSLVFTDTAQLVDWLNGNYEREDLFLPSELQIGQILFTVTTAEPDYWVSELPVTSLYQLVPFVDTIDLSNYFNKTEINSLLDDKVDKNNAITAGTKTKITYDSKGLVTGGADLVESDIPPLSPSKITQNTTNRFVTDTEKSTWNAKQESLPTITQAEINAGTSTTAVVITPKLLRDNFYTETEIDNMIGDIESVLDAILGV